VLVALCRPFRESPRAAPATNREIADELVVGVDAVKAQLRALYAGSAIDGLAQNKKRARLAAMALDRGLVTPRDLWE
jgi:hypothetical protein